MASIWETLIAEKTLSELLKVMRYVGFEHGLASSKTQFTLFAPHNDAFIKSRENFNPSSETTMWTLAVLNYHVIPDKLLLADILMHTKLSTLEGGGLEVSVHDALYINQARIITPNILCDNGVIHIIDKVLVPPVPSS